MKDKYLVIILALMVSGTVVAVGFVLWSNRNLPAQTIARIQKEANPCLGLSANPGEIPCEEAVEFATQKYPGSITGVQKTLRVIPDSEPTGFIWLITVKLDGPLQLPSPPFDTPELSSAKEAQIGVETTEKKVRFIQPIFEQ